MFYKPIHFKIQELVDRETFRLFGQEAWMFLQPNALVALDGIRNYFDRTVFVNDWHFNGTYQYRGFRPKTCSVGADYSQHRFGNAFDLNVLGLSAEEVRKEILAHKDDPRFRMITALEIGIQWVHFDCRNIAERIQLFEP